ncbi:T-cell surface glycoprotein CD3 zeta chain isoform X2 [Hippocampus comes]|uniref:T-cell surface glycoprotein CD3 zeta chain isoform X2 n=1 Tax=Hippocampus comes TaxID=109280 RepID=UPI00094E8C39|nr:PREDICTED: T-cell surface glycoprotein CD3 zeta chain isoform X2 [Hippocampus comes]
MRVRRHPPQQLLTTSCPTSRPKRHCLRDSEEFRMAFWWTSVLLVLLVQPADAMLTLYDPRLCYILDGFLGLYGLIITAMFIKEKGGRGQRDNGDLQLKGDPERGRNRWNNDNAIYTDLNRRTEDVYKKLPVKRERPRKNDQVYQDLSRATRETYEALQMQPLPAR